MLLGQSIYKVKTLKDESKHSTLQLGGNLITTLIKMLCVRRMTLQCINNIGEPKVRLTFFRQGERYTVT